MKRCGLRHPLYNAVQPLTPHFHRRTLFAPTKETLSSYNAKLTPLIAPPGTLAGARDADLSIGMETVAQSSGESPRIDHKSGLANESNMQ